MAVRYFLFLCATLVLLLAPVARAAAGDTAMARGAVVETSAATGHCTPVDAGEVDKIGQQLDCASACAALAIAPPRSIRDSSFATRSGRILADHPVLAGIEPDGRTPPPRLVWDPRR